ncbi:hypothetical protein GCM10027037_29980 [Mucilaginibacter koreensis]
MKKLMLMMALSAISFGSAFAYEFTPAKADVVQTDTIKTKKVKVKGNKMKKKKVVTKKDTMSKM